MLQPNVIVDERDPTKNLYYSVKNIVIDRGEGAWLVDDHGKRYLDCASGTFNLNLGYSHPEVLNAVQEQMEKLIHCTSSFQNSPMHQFAEKLVEVSPDNLTKVHPKVSSGSMANEGAIKIAQYVTGKRDVISLFRSHLGQSMMTLSLSGNAYRREPFPFFSQGAVHVPGPYCYRCFYNQKPESCNFLCVERINDFIEHSSSGHVACMILEPISGNGGNVVPPPGYLQALKQLCDENGILLIFDEIQTGIGRTGKMFAAQHFGVKPNMITTSKGLGGTGFQMSAIITEEHLTTLPLDHHAFTYGANILAATAATKTLEIVSEPSFLENVTTQGNYILSRLVTMQKRYRFMGDVRGVGLMIGVEIIGANGEPDPDLTNKIAKVAKEYGLIIRTSRNGYGNVFKIRPPLTINAEESEYMCDQLEKVLASVT